MASGDEIQDLQAKLKKIGWFITSEGVAQCCENLGHGKRTVENIVKSAVNCDLKDIGSNILTEDVKRGRASSIEGPIVLQIQKIRNVSAPKANEESSGAPRLLKIQLTDGHTTCFALENSSIQQLSLSTPPGTKVRLKGTVPLFIGFMLLEPGRIEKLGGLVEKLVTKWETNKSVTEQRSHVGVGGEGPPLFVPFDVKTSASTLKKPLNDKQAKTTHEPPKDLQQPGERTSKKVQEHGGNNKHQRAERFDNRDRRPETNRGSKGNVPAGFRHAQVPENESARKPKPTFSSNDNTHRKEDTGAYGRKPGQSDSRNNTWNKKDNRRLDNKEYHDAKGSRQRTERGGNDERGRNDRRGLRHDDNNGDYDFQEARPSQGTLWDYLEKNIPVKEKGANKVAKNNDTKDRKEHQDYPSGAVRPGTARTDLNKEINNKPRSPALDTTTSIITHEQQKSENDYRSRKGAQNDGKPFDKKHEAARHEKSKSGKQNEKSDHKSPHSRDMKKDGRSSTPEKTVSKNVSRGTTENRDSGTDKEYKQESRAGREVYTGGKKEHQFRKDDQFRNKKGYPTGKRETSELVGNSKSAAPRGASNGIEYNRNRTAVDSKGDKESSSKPGRDTGRNHTSGRKQDDEKKMGFNSMGKDATSSGPGQQEQKTHHQSCGEAESQANPTCTANKQNQSGVFGDKVGRFKDSQSSNTKEHVAVHYEGNKRNDRKSNEKQTNQKQLDERETTSSAGFFQPNQPMDRNLRHSSAHHWWKKGEHCMALCSADRQYHFARVVNIEARIQSCVVFFEDTKTTETVHWSSLLPLDSPNSYNQQMIPAPPTANSPYFQHPGMPYAVPVMQDRWMSPQPVPFQQYFPNEAQLQQIHSNPVSSSQINRPQMKRQTQAFYRPPTRQDYSS